MIFFNIHVLASGISTFESEFPTRTYTYHMRADGSWLRITCLFLDWIDLQSSKFILFLLVRLLMNMFIMLIIIIIIIIKICSAHISTLLGAQGAETKKKHEYKQFTVIAKTKLCTEIHVHVHVHVQYNYKYTSSLKNCDIR